MNQEEKKEEIKSQTEDGERARILCQQTEAWNGRTI